MNFSLINNLAVWESLQPEWNYLVERSTSRVPFLHYEFQRQWWRTMGGGEWAVGELMIITAREDAELVGIAPLFANTNSEGRKTIYLIGSFEIADYLDFIVLPDRLDGFTAGLFDLLSTWHPDKERVLDLYNLLDDSPTLAALETAARESGWKISKELLQVAPRIQLPGDWEQYLAGIDKKQRHEIRRKMRRLEHSGHGHRWYIVDKGNNLESEIEGFLHLMMQDAKKQAFLTASMQEQMRGTMQCAFREGCLHLAFLEIDGIRAAGYLSFLYDNQLWVYNSGVNHEQYEFSPGWVLLGYLLEWANENKLAYFDFMRGDEDYKYKFGAVNRSISRVQISLV